jgi:hypothetical protein
MARGGWTGFLRIQDDGSAKTIGSIQQGFDKVTKSFKTGFVQNFNSFSLMKKGIDAVVDSAKELIKESREMVTTSSKFSIPIEQLGELRNVAVQCGLGVNGLTGALGGLHQTLLDAVVNPGGEAAWTLDKLGYSQKEVQQISRRTGDAFYKFVDSIRQIEDATEREVKARAIWKGQYQEVMVLINKGQEEQDEMQRKAHKYTDEQVKNNELAAKSWDDVAERLKGIGELLTPIMGMIGAGVAFLASEFELLFEGLKMVIGTIILWIKEALKGIVNDITWAATQAKIGFKKLNPLNNYTSEDAKRDSEIEDARYWREEEKSSKVILDNAKLAERTRKNAVKALGNMQGALKDFGRQGRQFLVNIGGVDDQKTVASEEMNNLREEERQKKENMLKNFHEVQNARNVEGIIRSKEGDAAAQKYHESVVIPLIKDGDNMQESLSETQQKMAEVIAELKKVSPNAIWDEKSKMFIDKPKDKGPSKVVESYEQMNIRLAQNKAVRGQDVQRFTAGIDSWMKWSSGSAIAYKELQAAEANLADLMKNEATAGPEKINAALNAKINAEIKYQEKTREFSNLLEKGANDARLSAINRKNSAIEAQQSRDIFGMKMRGVSAIDQQNVVFRQAVEKIKREQKKYDDLSKDKYREQEFMQGNGSAALALKDSIQQLTFNAAKEMDTLMAMQFNYVSSDAAKKGMGGGIQMLNNPINIAMESRDYLKKIYETLSGAGRFDVVPEYRKGVKGWNMGSNGVLVDGRNVSSEPN